MASSASSSKPHVFANTLRFSARDFLALTKKTLVFKGAHFPNLPYASHFCIGGTASIVFSSLIKLTTIGKQSILSNSLPKLTH